MWKKATKCESGKQVVGWLHFTKTWPDDFCTLAPGPEAFGQNLARPSRPDMGQSCTVWSRLSLEEWNQIRCRKLGLDSGCTLATMAITGHNQNASESDLACLLGQCIRIKNTLKYKCTCRTLYYTVVLDAFELTCTLYSSSHNTPEFNSTLQPNKAMQWQGASVYRGRRPGSFCW